MNSSFFSSGYNRSGTLSVSRKLPAGSVKSAASHRIQILILLLIEWLLFAGALAGLHQDHYVRPVSDQVLRFRILPEDDSPEAQQIKLQARDLILSDLAAALPPDAGKNTVESYLRKHSAQLLEHIKKILPSDFHGNLSLSIENCWFPEKSYGALCFPSGTYHAAILRIGNASGRNWWCCLYPGLCYRDAVTAAVSEENEHALLEVLEDDSRILEGGPHYSFFLAEWLSRIFHT